MGKVVEIKNLTKIYEQPNQALIILKDLSFEVMDGDFISIIGPSGSGKTTLLNIISLLDSKYEGDVFFNGSDISKLAENKKSEVRLKDIGFVFQFDSLLEDFNVISNIEMPNLILKDVEETEKAYELLKKLYIEYLAQKMPQELSGGEKQRVALLRAMRNDPLLLVADEPTGNLDPENAMLVMSDLKKLNDAGKTIVIATHNIEMAKQFSKKIYFLTDKKLKELKD
ncbi:MAG: ABC transporter ATP-binding protein [Elusimicrobiales bacterium]|jgi:ABC-type lipoprotein export system ATPase subunit|nr:ABC transporter ATP-binding protein [Elusimicrobiales bacterium]